MEELENSLRQDMNEKVGFEEQLRMQQDYTQSAYGFQGKQQ